MKSLAHVKFKVDAIERDEIVCIGEILMQVKQNHKIIYRDIVVVDCQKTVNSPLTFPW